MIKLAQLLKESPDNIYWNERTYDYETPANIMAFLTFRDIKEKNEVRYFGYYYPDDKFVTNSETLRIGLQSQSNEYINYIRDLGYGGGHENLIDILRSLGHGAGVLYKGRLFNVEDADGNSHQIATFWDLREARQYRETWDKVFMDAGLDPKVLLYEAGFGEFVPYDMFYKLSQPTTSVEKEKVLSEIDTEIQKKNEELTEKYSTLHTNAGTMSRNAKKALKKQILLLEAELTLLKSAKNHGKSQLKDVDLEKAILMVIYNEPASVDELYADLEDKFKMPIAKLRQILADRGITLKQALKEYLDIKRKVNEIFKKAGHV